MKQIKLEKHERQRQILDAALSLAEKTHYRALTRAQIAERAGLKSATLITHHFGTMEQLYRDVMRAAVRQENLCVIAQGLATQDRHALKAPADLRARALASLSKAH